MTVVDVPNRDGISNEFGHTERTHKVIDLHIKIDGLVEPTRMISADQAFTSREDLAGALEYLGLYRIFSVSGNTIYTAQFRNGAKGNNFVQKIDGLLRRCTYAKSMIVEPCFLFLRNKNGETYAPICPLLE
jgi:hypothetical protein